MSIDDESKPIAPIAKAPNNNNGDVAFEIPPAEPAGGHILAENIDRLSTELAQERDLRREERFYWILLAAFLGDIVAFKALDHFGVFMVLFMFELVVLIGIANRLGVDWAVQGLGWFLHWLSERVTLPGGKD